MSFLQLNNYYESIIRIHNFLSMLPDFVTFYSVSFFYSRGNRTPCQISQSNQYVESNQKSLTPATCTYLPAMYPPSELTQCNLSSGNIILQPQKATLSPDNMDAMVFLSGDAEQVKRQSLRVNIVIIVIINYLLHTAIERKKCSNMNSRAGQQGKALTAAQKLQNYTKLYNKQIKIQNNFCNHSSHKL